MNKLIKAFCLTVVLGIGIFAQNNDDYKKNEFFVGYSYQPVDNGNRQSFNGFDVSGVHNFSRYFGIKGDFSGAYRNSEDDLFISNPINGSTTYIIKNNSSVYNVLGGIQVKDNASTTRFKPFAHALAGVAHTRFKSSNLRCSSGNCATTPIIFSDAAFSETRFAAAFGGGLDIKINDRFDFRAIQADYNPIFFGNSIQNNFRFGIGIVIK